jgi:hypothetical protein
MATLKSKIQISSSDFFSQSLNLSTSTTTSTSGDDRAFSVERVDLGVRPTSTLTQAETVLSNMNSKTLTLTDAYQNTHTVTFSTAYANTLGGVASSGSITVLSTVLATWNGKTLTMSDNLATPRALTITFNNTTTTIVRGTCTSTVIAYAVGLSGLTTTEAIRDKIITAISNISNANDFSMTATKNISNTAVIDLTQSIVGNVTTPAIAGTAESNSLISAVDFTKGGAGYTSSFVGISNNAATTTAHLTSLRNTLLLAKEEGKLMIDPGAVPTASTLTLSMIGPYVSSKLSLPTGTAITASEMSATTFTGGDVPLVFPCGEFNSAHQKVYLYIVNKSGSGTVNFYVKDTTSRSEGTITASQADTSGISTGKTLILTSSKGIAYTLTSVAPDAATANTRVSDTAYYYGDGDTMELTMNNIITTLGLIKNNASRETTPFTASLDSTTVLRIEQNAVDGGTSGNTAITGTLISEGIISTTGITGGIDSYHLFARLGPKEFLYVPMAGSPKLYADSEDSTSEVEYLTLEA